MSTQLRSIAIVCMVLILLGAPCVAACPYSTTGNSASSSTDDGSSQVCTSNLCTGSSCSDNSTPYSPYASGTFKCTDGNCVGKYCVNGKCDTTEVDDSSAGNASGVILCNGDTCKAKVCNGNGTCNTNSFSTNGDNSEMASWFSKIFGGNDDSTAPSVETSTCDSGNQEITTAPTQETTTVPSTSGVTYTMVGSSKPQTSTNYFGTFASTGTTETPSENTTPEVSTCSTCKSGTSCDAKSCDAKSCENGNTCSQCETTTPVTTTTTPAVSTTTASTSSDNSGCTAYDKVYAALRADKTEKNVLSDSYTSLNFAQDVCSAMKTQGIDCEIVKVTFTDGTVNYLNAFKTCNGGLLVDSCGTALGTGIKKQVTVLEVGQQWTAKSLFGECGKTYTRGTVSSIE